MKQSFDEYKQKLNKEKNKFRLIIIALLILLIFVCLLSLGSGRADLDLITIAKILIGKIFASDVLTEIEEYKIAIVWDIRLPRVLVGALIGAGLAVAGAIFQAILRNPLADPYTIGVSTGAAFGGSLAIYLNMFILSSIVSVTLFAFVGAVLTLYLVMKISKVNGIRTKNNLILSGIIIGSILSAGISFIKTISGEEVSAIIYWLMGNLSSKSWNHILLAFPFITLAVLIASKMALKLDVMSLGRSESSSLGIDYEKASRYFLILASIITAVCVSIGGVIGFIGLIVPHLVRNSFTTKNQYLIPISSLLGAILLVLADSISRVLLSIELPVGIITTLLGGPFFIYIYTNKNKESYC